MIVIAPQGYLLRHLKVGKGASAARHDPDRSRFRLVASRQAGNGKSLLCRRIKERNEAAGGGTSSTLQIQANILFLKHDSSMFRQSSNPVCGSWQSQSSSPWAKQRRDEPVPSWRNHIQSWTNV